MLSVKGLYQNGSVILLEPVPFLKSLDVLVTFIEKDEKEAINKKSKSLKGILSGKYKFEEKDLEEAKKIWG